MLEKIALYAPYLVIGAQFILWGLALWLDKRAKADPAETWEDKAVGPVKWASENLWYVSEIWGRINGKQGDEKAAKLKALVAEFESRFGANRSDAIQWVVGQAFAAQAKLPVAVNPQSPPAQS